MREDIVRFIKRNREIAWAYEDAVANNDEAARLESIAAHNALWLEIEKAGQAACSIVNWAEGNEERYEGTHGGLIVDTYERSHLEIIKPLLDEAEVDALYWSAIVSIEGLADFIRDGWTIRTDLGGLGYIGSGLYEIKKKGTYIIDHRKTAAFFLTRELPLNTAEF